MAVAWATWKATLFGLRSKFSDVNHVTTEQADQMLSRGEVTWLDCRPDKEFQVSHLDGAIQVDFDGSDEHIKEKLQTALATHKPHCICYCSVGYRSSVVARKMKALYQADASLQAEQPAVQFHNLEGSIFKWANEQRPMVNARGETAFLVHPFDKTWGKLLKAELWDRSAQL